MLMLGSYVQAVTDDKRKSQSRVVKMLLPAIQRAMLLLVDVSGRAADQSDPANA
jgi:hypothetical protein